MDYSNWILSNTNKTKEILNNYNNKNINKKLQKKTQFKVVKNLRKYQSISSHFELPISILQTNICFYYERSDHFALCQQKTTFKRT